MFPQVEFQGPTFVVSGSHPVRGVARDVADDIQRAIRTSGYAALYRLDVDFQAGVATLRGRVPSWYLRQMAQMLVRRVPGVEQLVDCLEVVDGDFRADACRRPR